MGKAPSFQYYPNDWLNDVELQSASAQTIGVWANCLSRMWGAKSKGELTGGRKTLARLCMVTEQEFTQFIQEAQALRFCDISVTDNGGVTVRNRRMFREQKDRENTRIRQERFRDKQKCNGKVTVPSSSSSSSSPSSSKKRTKDIAQTDDNHERRFLVFWSKYPKKKSKLAARKAFDKISPEGDLFNQIIDKIEEASKSHDWTKDSGKFIPYPERWLNSGGWEDEYKPQDNRFSDITRQNIEMFNNWEPPEDTK